jgi:hypothetical protein
MKTFLACVSGLLSIAMVLLVVWSVLRSPRTVPQLDDRKLRELARPLPKRHSILLSLSLSLSAIVLCGFVFDDLQGSVDAVPATRAAGAPLEKFDQNKNGVIDPDERAQMEKEGGNTALVPLQPSPSESRSRISLNIAQPVSLIILVLSTLAIHYVYRMRALDELIRRSCPNLETELSTLGPVVIPRNRKLVLFLAFSLPLLFAAAVLIWR